MDVATNLTISATVFPGITDFLNDSWVLMPALWNGLIVTLQLVALTAPFGLLLGLLIAAARVYGACPVRWAAQLYVIIFRGCPLVLLLFILYFGLPSIGISLGSFLSALIGFILCNSAYNSEYIRGALQSVKSGQMYAAQALSMTKLQAIRYIVIPQALRRALPGVSNEFIYLIKYSSLAYTVTVIELVGAAKNIANKHPIYFAEVFAAVGIFYLVIVTIATIAFNWMEKKYAIPGTGARKRA
ncbi:MAG TPA: amino acid ABC transporter permease [Methanocorpusculum sp.]|nr:amino acid ABC transporter permease [Methanocorpusculum sp.]